MKRLGKFLFKEAIYLTTTLFLIGVGFVATYFYIGMAKLWCTPLISEYVCTLTIK